MIIEKRSRYFRLYDLITTPRSSRGAALPLVGEDSLLQLFTRACDDGTAVVEQPNRDSIELIKVEEVGNGTHVALLFHRASPDAPDPIYRRKANDRLNLRSTEKDEDEEQAFSAHLVIEAQPRSPGRYRMVLEEVPGLSAQAIVGVLRKVASAGHYECTDDRGRRLETYTVLKCDGYSSQSLEDSLGTGRVTFFELSRAPEAELEQDGAYIPSREKVKLRVGERFTRDNWKRKFSEMLRISERNGYDDVKVTIMFDDRRSTTISLDRDADAAEVMMVRAQRFDFDDDLELCYIDFHDPIVRKALSYVRG